MLRKALERSLPQNRAKTGVHHADSPRRYDRAPPKREGEDTVGRHQPSPPPSRMWGPLETLPHSGVAVSAQMTSSPHTNRAHEDECARLASGQAVGVKATLEVLTRTERRDDLPKQDRDTCRARAVLPG